MTIADRVQVLAARLETGWTICEQERDPDRLAILEAHWIALLHEYEELCDLARSVMTAATLPGDRRAPRIPGHRPTWPCPP